MSDTTEKLTAEVVHAKAIDEYESRSFRRHLVRIAAKTGAAVVVIAAIAAASKINEPKVPTHVESD